MAVQLFLSCVSDEFGVYRDELRRKLTRPNVEVKIQEDFKALGGDTLIMLEEYIEHCEAVVHFVGDMAGSTPKDFSVGELLARRGDLKTRLPPLRAALEARETISYTQWEAWLAIYFRKDLVIAAPGQGFVRDRKMAAKKKSEEAQAAHLSGNGEAFRRAACSHGLEGVVSKRTDRRYLPGDRGVWVKSKCLNRAEFVIVGWSDPEGSRHGLGSLLLGYYDDGGRLLYAGRVGTGMSFKTLAMLQERLKPLAFAKMPLAVAPTRKTRFGGRLALYKVHWVRPELPHPARRRNSA